MVLTTRSVLELVRSLKRLRRWNSGLESKLRRVNGVDVEFPTVVMSSENTTKLISVFRHFV
jgi:hypothetical protein